MERASEPYSVRAWRAMDTLTLPVGGPAMQGTCTALPKSPWACQCHRAHGSKEHVGLTV